MGLVYANLETEGVRRKISISGTSKGLGIRIVGGRTVKLSDKESHFGIFIKEVIRDSLAEKDGKSLNSTNTSYIQTFFQATSGKETKYWK